MFYISRVEIDELLLAGCTLDFSDISFSCWWTKSSVSGFLFDSKIGVWCVRDKGSEGWSPPKLDNPGSGFCLWSPGDQMSLRRSPSSVVSDMWPMRGRAGDIIGQSEAAWHSWQHLSVTWHRDNGDQWSAPGCSACHNSFVTLSRAPSRRHSLLTPRTLSRMLSVLCLAVRGPC